MKKRWLLSAAVALGILANSFTFSFAAVRGDLNGDGSVNSLDFGLQRMYLLGGYQLNDTFCKLIGLWFAKKVSLRRLPTQ
jgi:hypothetical protein